MPEVFGEKVHATNNRGDKCGVAAATPLPAIASATRSGKLF
jgi:hypothetical protein